jgi:DNA polymerase (family X)
MEWGRWNLSTGTHAERLVNLLFLQIRQRRKPRYAKRTMTREKMADVFEEIALLLELKGENPFKVRAYRTAAETVVSFPGDIVAKAVGQELAGIKGIGDALRDKLHELATTNQLGFHEKLRAEFPETIFELFELQGLGPKKVALLYKELGVGSIASLTEAIDGGKLDGLAGFGEKSVQKLKDSISFHQSHAGIFRQEQVAHEVELLLEALRSHPRVSRVEVAGSYRRGKETVHDLDFLVATPEPEEVMHFFTSQNWAKETIANGVTKSSIRLESGIQCDLRAVTNSQFPFALAYFTGSKEHNVAMRSRALKYGWTLNEYRFATTEEANDPPPNDITEEKDIYRALDLDYVPPELRENTGEIDAAEQGKLPRLVEMEFLRGTFHNHTTASDGRNTLLEMAEAARDMGMEYLGIADHSKASFQANGLDESRLREQIAEIRRLNETWDDFKLFAGSEVDILKDGSLDFSNELMAELDYVVASVHNAFQLSEAEMTKRILKAVENPHVTMLGHLTGRLLLKREPYAVNIPAIIDACAATGTIIELNANPWRLDLDWRWWRLAKEKGVLCSINPDAHSTDGLHDLFYGLKIARKGWLEREDVVNCRKLRDIIPILNRKRKLPTLQSVQLP